MTEHFDAAALGQRSGDFAFGGDVAAIADALRALADRIETGVALVLKVHSGSAISPEDFATRSVLIRYVEKL